MTRCVIILDDAARHVYRIIGEAAAIGCVMVALTISHCNLQGTFNMATSLLDRFDLSTLTELPERAQRELEQRTTDAKRKLEDSQARALGQLRDSSRQLAFRVASSSLQTASSLLERAPVKPAPVTRSKERLERCAAFWGERERLVDAPSLEGYDELNVKQVNAALDSLDVYQLEKLRAYEAANKNRVTILREVERRLER